MRDIGEGTIRHIDWQELTPVVLLFRVFPTAIDLRVLFFSMIGLLMTLVTGYLINVTVWKSSVEKNFDAVINATEIIPSDELVRSIPGEGDIFTKPTYIAPLADFRTLPPISFRAEPVTYTWRLVQRSVLIPWDIFTSAGCRFFAVQSPSWGERGISFGWLVFLVLVWTFYGGMICRTAAVRLTVDESESFGTLMRFFKDRGTGFLNCLLILCVGILFLAMIIKLFGWFYSVPFLNYLLSLFFPLVLVLALGVMFLAVGLFLGWPLMFAAVGVDGSDGFDAISRAFSYLNNRPLHFLFYWAVSALLGVIGFIFVSLFVDGTVALSVKIAGIPLDAAHIHAFGTLAGPHSVNPAGFPDRMVYSWCLMFQCLKLAYVFGWFWVTGVTVYLLLRRSVDGTPISEVLRLGPAAEPPKKMPEINLNVHPVAKPEEKTE